MRTKIIAGFPGVGKTKAAGLLGDRALDSDSSGFGWVTGSQGKRRNPYWPQNYVTHIRENIGKKEFIFVSTHKEVRDVLLDNCIFFYLVFPDPADREEYLWRYRSRGNDQAFVDLIGENWWNWINELRDVGPGCHKIMMQGGHLLGELSAITEGCP